MLITLNTLNIYFGSFMKNVFCLKRPAGTGTSDFGWPSLHCITATSLPFFLLRCFYGNSWLWEHESPARTFAVFGSVFIICFLVITARLYFGRSSPADVQAGCLIGAGLLRIWLSYATLVDHAVLNTVRFWPILGIAVALLVVHPVALRPQLGGPQPFLNDTYWLMVRMLGFCAGYLMGYVHTAILYSAPISLPSSNLLAFMRWSVGLNILGAIAYIVHTIQLAATEGTLEFLVMRVLKDPSGTTKLG